MTDSIYGWLSQIIYTTGKYCSLPKMCDRFNIFMVKVASRNFTVLVCLATSVVTAGHKSSHAKY